MRRDARRLETFPLRALREGTESETVTCLFSIHSHPGVRALKMTLTVTYFCPRSPLGFIDHHRTL